MSSRFKKWQIAGLFLVLGGLAVGLFLGRKSRVEYDAAHLLLCLPLDHAVKVYIDVDALRAGGLLESSAGTKTAEEPDYRKFVQDTGFDYQKDLDAVAAAFVHGDTFMTIRGRFDWKRLADYARGQGGGCSNDICSMPASRPGQRISYRLLRGGMLALAVSTDDHAATKISQPSADKAPFVPSSAIWVSAPGEAFNDLAGLPDGAHILSPLAEANEASFEVREKEIRLDAACPSPKVALKIVERFTATTDLLRRMLEREKQTPKPADLSGVLVAGRFQTQASHAIGTWPIEKQFVESLFSGGSR
jgi:hypothetical protein